MMPEEALARDADEDQRQIYLESFEEDQALEEDLDKPMSDTLIQWILENF